MRSKKGTMSETRVSIKGTKDGLLITLGEGDLTDCLAELGALLRDKASFFKGGKVALQVDDRRLAGEEIQGIGRLLAQNGITLWAVVSEATDTRAAARRLGLETTLRSELEKRSSLEDEFDEAVLVRRTLRSGQLVQHAGHVVVIGDVNPGAEIVAGGNIVVWGRLRGTVHAGAKGDDQAVVCALDLSPTQLRIGNYIARSPEEKQEELCPEIASVRDGHIVAEAWPGHQFNSPL